MRFAGKSRVTNLGHKLKGVEGAYKRHDYFEERRRALAAWGPLLLRSAKDRRRRSRRRRIGKRRWPRKLDNY
jgi:hypothetical protein